jgi:hypothetical protein
MNQSQSITPLDELANLLQFRFSLAPGPYEQTLATCGLQTAPAQLSVFVADIGHRFHARISGLTSV